MPISVESNRRALALANDLYRSGLTDFLSVLDADRMVHLAEEEEDERANSLAMVALAKALGGGWEAQGP